MTNLIALPNGTELVGDYRIERVLGAGGFGVTYLADEIALARLVTIKEYFPSDIAARNAGVDAAPRSQDCAGDYRWGLDRFIEEAQTLAKFDHANIVRVYRYFRANNTGYMVLHFEEGLSLKGWLKGLGRAPRQKELDAILGPLLEALELIHGADFLHRDIAPDNIIIRKAGDPVLIDFGSARGEIASHTKTVSALVKPGYSPYEQYAETSSRQGPWTDIYALGGTLYHAITGKRPPDSPSRMVKDELVSAREAALSSYRAGFLKAIDKALALNIESRPQSIAAWRNDLFAPDPVRTRWLGRTERRKKKDAEAEVAAVGEAAPARAPATPAKSAVAATVPLAAAVAELEPVTGATPPAQPPPASTPPAPDAPGPKGGLLDFLEGLRKKPDEQELSPSPAPPPEPKKKTPAAAAPALALKKKSQSKKPIPKERALVPVKSPPRPRPRPLKVSRPNLFPILFKLLVGVGVASAAVAMQDRLPQFESRGSAVTTGQLQTPVPKTPDSPALVTPLAEIDAHRGSVTNLAYSDDGRWIVTVGADGALKLWDAEHHNLVRTIELDDGPATALALKGHRALTGHGNGRIVLWDLNTADKIASVQRNEAKIWAVAFLGEADRFASASHDWKVTLWDPAASSAPLQVLEGHENAVQSLAYSPVRKMLASGSADKTVRLWELDTLALKRRYRGMRDFVTTVTFSPNGKLLAAGALDGRIQIWSALSSRRMRSLAGHRGRIADTAFSPNGNYLASAGEDGTVRLWDVSRGRILRALTGHVGGATSVAFAADGQRLASAGIDGRVRLWAVPLGALARD